MKNKITFYTVQSPEVYDILKRDGIVHPKEFIHEDESMKCFKNGYDWVSRRMFEKGIKKEDDCRMFWGHDLLKYCKGYNGVILKVTKPVEEVFITDYQLYHQILNDAPVIILNVSCKDKNFEAIWDKEHTRVWSDKELTRNTWDVVDDFKFGRKGIILKGDKLRKLDKMENLFHPNSKSCLQLTVNDLKLSEVKYLGKSK